MRILDMGQGRLDLMVFFEYSYKLPDIQQNANMIDGCGTLHCKQ